MTILNRSLLKWCGNKREALITDDIYQLFQEHRRDVNDNSLYISPFGGAMGDVIAINPEQAFVGDTNILLISLYQLLCDGDFHGKFVWNMVNNEAIFVSIRDRFNIMKAIVSDMAFGVTITEDRVADLGSFCFTDDLNWRIAKGGAPTDETLDLIKIQCCIDLMWLNKAGFNGLYRENQSGYYNVPIGRRGSGAFNSVDMPNLNEHQEFMRRHNFYCGDYSSLETAYYETYGDRPFSGNMIYCDPIYVGSGAMYGSLPIDYEHMAKMVLKWHHQGNTVAISNASTKEMIELYSDLGFEISYTTYQQKVSCDANSRGQTGELLAYKTLSV